MLCTILVLSINQVASAINCNLEIVKITRCSTNLANAADSLSKANFTQFRNYMPEAELQMLRVPRAVLKWIENPCEDRLLGKRIIYEMQIPMNILGYSGMYFKN